MKLFEDKNIFHRTHLTTTRGGSLDRDLHGFHLDQMEVNQRGFHHNLEFCATRRIILVLAFVFQLFNQKGFHHHTNLVQQGGLF